MKMIGVKTAVSLFLPYGLVVIFLCQSKNVPVKVVSI